MAFILSFHRQNLNPIVVGVVDKVEVHLVVLVAEAAHLAVVLAQLLVVRLDTQTEVALVLAQLPGAVGVVAQPGELQREVRRVVAHEDDLVAAVLGFALADHMQAEGLLVERYAALEVLYIDVEVVESCSNFHSFKY